jgi:hypothetical protein
MNKMLWLGIMQLFASTRRAVGRSFAVVCCLHVKTYDNAPIPGTHYHNSSRVHPASENSQQSAQVPIVEVGKE